ncbi:MAG: flagellar assembly protein FliX [Alphaproteobacteria bacterium]|nr:flagellar assembly protein FliX [Alphaproteobacteria bacterium]
MRVTGPGKVGGVTQGKSAKKTEAAPGFADLLRSTDEVHTSTSIAPAQAPPPVDSLLTLQEVPTSTQRRSAGLKRGRMLLDGLDEIRHGLLVGAISPAKVRDILLAVRAEKLDVDEPALKQVLDEIDLRAQVELAKLGHFA